MLRAAGLPTIPTDAHIVPVPVGNRQTCRAASDPLLIRHGIYLRPINCLILATGTERLGNTPSPLTHGMIGA
jgi:5-aminolevulinate synthase